MTGTITAWPNLTTTIGAARELDWQTLFDQFSHEVAFDGDRHPGWSPATFSDNKRSIEAVTQLFALVLDVDGTWALTEAANAFSDQFGFIHTSKSHTDEVHRFRIILPTSRPFSAYEHAALWRRIDAAFPGKFDPQAKDASRFWYMPGTTSGGPFETVRLNGSPLNVDAWLARPEPFDKRNAAPQQTTPRTNVEERARRYIATMPPAISGSHGHDATWRVAIVLARGFGLSEDRVLDLLRSEYNPRCQPPWHEKDLRHKASQAMRASIAHGYLLGDDADQPHHEAPDLDAAVSTMPRHDAAPADDAGRMPGDDSDETEPGQMAWERYGVRRVCDTMRAVWESCQAKEPTPSVSTTHAILDWLIGGYRRRFVTVLGAQTSFGKTSFAIASTDDALRCGKRVLIVSFEDAEEVYGKRLAARRKNINALNLRNGILEKTRENDEHGRLLLAVNDAEEIPWFLDAVGKSAEYVSRAISDLCAEWNYDLVIIDYIQKVRCKAQDRRNEVRVAFDMLGAAIKNGNAAGLVLSQVKRIEGTVPTIADLKEAGDVENGAEHVLMGGTGDVGRRFVKLEKNKDGQQRHNPIYLDFDEVTASFRTVRTRYEDGYE